MTADDQSRDDIEQLRAWIRACAPGRMVFFGGAGVSTESGIPDFRSADGLYAQQYPYPPETMVSRSFFDAHPREFYDFYCDRMLALDAEPNAAHRKLAELEQAGTLSAVVTQNIDGLHQKAGSHTVWELHGSVLRNFCMDCRAPFTVEELLALREQAPDGVPRCPHCDGIVKPDVVLYEEPLNDTTVLGAVQAIAHADLLVIAGTSLAVYPAAGLIDYFEGDHVAIINRTPTPRDATADLCITANVGEVLGF
ncbi:NAD-dependent protein deacylase [uncultured Adlercreutzia sp.]|uniref:NAD-dependent protein deacylase n=1 Tax=uncultured Adlercreutzia sp. TaxID=875803 RepID=UPI0026744E81|nr:NAD-dependent protein deacylase [uncultured Adlercreutzia sp.]